MSSRELLDLAWIVPALPLFGALLLLFVGRRIGEPVAGWIATGLMALAFVVVDRDVRRAARPARRRAGQRRTTSSRGSRRARSR